MYIFFIPDLNTNFTMLKEALPNSKQGKIQSLAKDQYKLTQLLKNYY